MDSGLNVLGIISLVVTIVLTILIFRLQGTAQEKLQDLSRSIHESVEETRELVREMSERRAEAENQRVEEDSDAPSETLTKSGEPADVAEYIDELKDRGIPLNFNNLKWRRKVRCGGTGRGNLGWFVEDESGKRYFFHRGREVTVRPAIPRDFLNAWEATSERNPCEIELDYRTATGRGNHAWFIRTYDGDTWRIAKGNNSLKATLLEEA